MFWFFHRGLPATPKLGEGGSPHLQRAHAGRTQSGRGNPYKLALLLRLRAFVFHRLSSLAACVPAFRGTSPPTLAENMTNFRRLLPYLILVILQSFAFAEEEQFEARIFRSSDVSPPGQPAHILPLGQQWANQFGAIPKGTEIVPNGTLGVIYVRSTPALLKWLEKRYEDENIVSGPYVVLRRYRLSHDEVNELISETRKAQKSTILPKKTVDAVFVTNARWGNTFEAVFQRENESERFEGQIDQTPVPNIVECSFVLSADKGEISTRNDWSKTSSSFTSPTGEERMIFMFGADKGKFLYTCEILRDFRVNMNPPAEK
jgi:hypothetical protein